MSTDQIQSQPEIQQDSQPQPDIQNINDSQQVQQMLNEETQNIASIAEGGRELSKTVLYVGNIHRSVSDEAIQDLFNSLGNPIKSIKVLQDKNKPGFNYAFIEFDTAEATTNALQALNGTTVADNQLKITKAFQTQQIKNSDTFNLFIGDLSLEVNDELLNSSFQKFPSLVQANVMWDMKSGRSRGYGFVCFVDKKDAEEALQTMNGFVLGDRPIRLNWASHRDHNNNNNNNQNHNHYHYNNNNNNNQNMNYYNNNNNNNNNNMNYNNHYNNNNNMNGINNMNNNPTTNNSNNNMNSSMNNNMNMMNMNMMNNSSFNASNSSTNSNGMLVNNNSNNNTSNMNVNNMGNLNNINNMNHINNGNKVRNNMMTMNSMDMINNQQNGGNINGVNNRMPIMGPPSYEMVLRQTPNWLSVVYLGNLADYTTQNDLIPLLQNFGYIVNFKLLSDKGCAFVTYDTHERAALAIVQLSGFTINGRPLKCGWGKANKVVGNMRNVPPGIRN